MTLWWSNRKNQIRISFDKSVLGDDIDAYLTAAESRIAEIRPGLQKQVIWVDPARKLRTPYSLIYLHGFSASSGEIRPVPDLVAGHLKANLYFTRLNGHGADGDALGNATIEAWVDDVAEAIAIGERIGERVIVMATSTGAALITWALAQPALAANITAAVLFSPNYALQARGASLLSAPFARQIVRAVIGRTRGFEPVNAEHARIWTHHYPTDALLPMAAAMQLANSAEIEATTVPALFLYSPNDRTVDPQKIVAVAQRWGATHRLIAIEKTEDPSSHVIAGDVLAPSNTSAITRDICDWLDTTLHACR
ncbi:MAG: Alpha/beta hydrolase family protein [Rhizobium sp.]|nr:Alpha/beta hydrolase family protein [Rhizobium sp.]